VRLELSRWLNTRLQCSDTVSRVSSHVKYCLWNVKLCWVKSVSVAVTEWRVFPRHLDVYCVSSSFNSATDHCWCLPTDCYISPLSICSRWTMPCREVVLIVVSQFCCRCCLYLCDIGSSGDSSEACLLLLFSIKFS